MTEVWVIASILAFVGGTAWGMILSHIIRHPGEKRRDL